MQVHHRNALADRHAPVTDPLRSDHPHVVIPSSYGNFTLESRSMPRILALFLLLVLTRMEVTPWCLRRLNFSRGTLTDLLNRRHDFNLLESPDGSYTAGQRQRNDLVNKKFAKKKRSKRLAVMASENDLLISKR